MGDTTAPHGPRLTRGTTVLELTRPLPDRHLRLFDLPGDGVDPGLRILRNPGGHILAEAGAARAVIALGRMERASALRIALTWSGPARPARLWVSAPSIDITPRAATLATAPRPATRESCDLISDPAAGGWPSEVAYVALSSGVEPVGPMPGLAGGTPVQTPGGLRRLDSLSPGEPVIGRDARGRAAPVPVLARLRHRLPARGAFRPVQIHAPYFGLTADLILSAGAHVTLSGPDVDYLFAREKVLVPAGHLATGRTGRWLATGDTVEWHQLLLPGQEQICAAGCTLDSLHIGQLRRRPEAHGASLLAHLPRARLPHHAATTYPVLTEFEAATLLDQLSR